MSVTLSLRFADNQPGDDQTIIAALMHPAGQRPERMRPGESGLTKAGVLLAAPVWLAAIMIAVIARLARGRFPVVVWHERVGHGRTQLWVPKIATAKVARNKRRWGGLVEIATGPPVELEVDGRVERWLRTTGADELPQLALVLTGKMRLVGPRPVTREELDEMAAGDREVGVDVLQPGLIGLWQVLDRHRYELIERRDLDMLMINNWTARLRRRLVTTAARQALRRAKPHRLW